ncbi:plasmid mobilization protein [Acidithiobacillus ferrooxidans]|uniref:plasmid mobilization protein n=1 Tax=Acidithiobacillus ferrooxidans TaxID=920 RepID=UPI000A4B07E7
MPTQYTTVLRLRMLPEDYAAVKAKAEAYRQPLSAFARNAICGIPMVCHLDEDAVEMLLRLGGLLLKHGKDSEDSGWTIAQRKAFLELAHRLLGIAARIEESLPVDDGVAPGRVAPGGVAPGDREDSPC